MNELQLITGCKNQNRQAQKEIYETYARTMYGICLRYASDTDEAKDWLQDGFMHVFSKIESYEGRGSFEGWMRRVFVNLALGNLRKRKGIVEISENIDEIPDVPDDVDDGMEDISAGELMAIIKELPDGYATVFNLYAVEDYSHKEIAEQLDISEGTSRSQYARARKLLQEKVTQYLKERY